MKINLTPGRMPSCILRGFATILHTLYTLLGKDTFLSNETSPFELHKNGARNNFENYRGIARLGPYLFEPLLVNRFSPVLMFVVLLFHHGFIKRRQTSTNLLELVRHIYNGFLVRKQTDVFLRRLIRLTTNHSYLNCMAYVFLSN